MSASIHLQLPDGSLRQVPRGTTVAEVAAGIGKGLAKAAVAGVVDGNVVETARPIQGDASTASTRAVSTGRADQLFYTRTDVAPVDDVPVKSQAKWAWNYRCRTHV